MFWTVLFCLCFWRLDGVLSDGEEVESVSVTEGDSVALNSRLTEIKDDDEIQWRFGDTVIAEINKRADRFTVYDDVLDGRFRDRLKLDNQTGSLTITNIRPEEAGLYSVAINSEIKKQIDVYVYGSVKSVLLTEGDSVALVSNLTEIKDDDVIQWRFGDTVIAEINKRDDRFTVYDDVLDGRFRDRLKLDNQTGSLTITNTRTEHTGLYEREINYMITEFFLAVFEEISVMVGDSVALNSNLTEIKDDNVIRWWFGDTVIAEINKRDDRFTVYDDVLDGRFRDRLKLDNQTGSLTITDIRTEDDGDYTLEMSVSDRYSLKAFSVSVALPVPVNSRDSVHCCGSTEAVIRLVLAALVGVATVILQVEG
ncbi:uncharacterized protein [Pseudorasbora parva]|uniref:uncharacterized protein n=1 Tax=Pseudorasbora parva TaxID=51549 RepID=UPI00351E0862